MVDLILKSGGATLDRTGKIRTLKSGYQVSVEDVAVIDEQNFSATLVNKIVEKAKAVKAYAGFWVDGGKVYADISKRFATKGEAVEVGRRLNQQSILRWSDMGLVWLKG